MANNDLSRLRAEVLARHKAATKKVSRMKRSGADIGGTKHDPRRNPAVIKKYNTAQLNAYLKSLNQFQSRNVGFVQTANGLVTRQEWRNYKALEHRFNKLGQRTESRFMNKKVPGAGLTVEERLAQRPKNFRKAGGEATNRPFREFDSDARNVNGPKALKKLTKKMEQRLAKNYLPKELAAARRQFAQMAKNMNSPSLVKSMKKLTDDQFYFAWNFTSLAESMGNTYDIAMKIQSDAEERWYSTVITDRTKGIEELLSDAANVRFEAQESSAPRRRR